MISSPTGSVSRIASLDGFRAIAAIIVFISHNGLGDRVPGGFGVSIFFFLSGYLISTLLRVEHEETNTINLKNFYLRRVFRILPPFYIVLLLSAIPPFGHLNPDTTVGAVTAQLTQFTNYYIVFFGFKHIIPMTGAMWSLSVEEHFYLLFPFGLRWMLGKYERRKIAAILLALCGAVLVWRCILIFLIGADADYTYYATDTRIDSLLFGCIMAFWANPALDPESLPFSPRAWKYLLAAGVLCIFFTLGFRNAAFRETIRYSLQGIGLFAVFFCAIRYHQWPLFRWLEHPWVRGMGLISYTFYLSHQKSLQMAGRIIGHEPIPRAFLGLFLAIAFSTAMYFVVERPFAVIRRRLHRQVAITA